jgi:hypothetical protein
MHPIRIQKKKKFKSLLYKDVILSSYITNFEVK